MDFKDQVIVITGGSRGIGKSIAIEFSKLKASVVLIARNKETLEEVAATIQKDWLNKCVPFCGDVSNMFDMQRIFHQIEEQFGCIDVLINCAGINIRKSTFESTEEDWDKVIDVNLKGTFLCCKLACEIMKKKNGGSIINISSVGAKRGSTSPHYSASKAGINGLSACLAKEMAPFGIRVNVVSPGAVETDMAKQWSSSKRQKLIGETPLGRIGAPIEIAKAVVFLASEDASFITGENLDVNGGMVRD